MDDDEFLAKVKSSALVRRRLTMMKRIGRRYNKELFLAKLRELAIGEENPKDQLEECFWGRVFDYEEVLKSERGDHMRARYTRDSVKRSSVREFLERLMLKKSSFGWRFLSDVKRTDVSYETVVIKYRHEFKKEVAKAALRRLKEAKKAGNMPSNVNGRRSG